MITGILSAFSLLGLSFAAYFIKDFVANRHKLEKETNIPVTASIGFVTLFFDTLGIGCFAPQTTAYSGITRSESSRILFKRYSWLESHILLALMTEITWGFFPSALVFIQENNSSIVN